MPKTESTRLVSEDRSQSCIIIESCRSSKLGSQRTPRDEVVHDILFWCQHSTMIMLHRLCYAEPTVSRQRNLGHEAEIFRLRQRHPSVQIVCLHNDNDVQELWKVLSRMSETDDLHPDDRVFSGPGRINHPRFPLPARNVLLRRSIPRAQVRGVTVSMPSLNL